jgi:metallophosphoesterase (TIGR00282 family)
MSENIRILFIGDIVGRAGRAGIMRVLPEMKKTLLPDLVIANCENAAGGFGATQEALRELENAGVDFFTSGNHIWDKKEVLKIIGEKKNLLRPANYPDGVPGNGWRIVEIDKGKVGIINLAGRVFMEPLDCPFRKAKEIIPEIKKETNVIIVDFHAEATSEKMAMGLYLAGEVSAVIGTHTHVQTSDERILEGWTGYITDVGMAGDVNSVIGMDASIAIERFLFHIPKKFRPSEGKSIEVQSVFLEISKDGACKRIERVNRKI